MVQSHLNRDPLVVWDIDLLRDRFIVILVGKEEEAGRVPTHQIEHEDTFNFDQVTVALSFRWSERCACRLVDLKSHRHGVFVLILLHVVGDLKDLQLVFFIVAQGRNLME